MRWLIFLPFFLFQQENKPPERQNIGKTPKNIILLIGDGMGLTQISAGLYSHGNQLHIEQMPVTGLIKTHASNKLITDSAAGATAFSCGCKTYNGAIAVDKKKQPCRTILEWAKQQGKACGLVASCTVTHATPGAFIAHVPQRAEMENIAVFFVENPIDLVIGGGMKFFETRSSDRRNLTAELRSKGTHVSNFNQINLQDCVPSPDSPFVWFSANEEPPSVEKGRNYLPYAARMAAPFLQKRSKGKGFFMMLEGSQIDWACHSNDAPRAISEMLDFDQAVGEILKFAAADGETLVIVTADHETAGMSIDQGSVMDTLDIKFNSGYHTASMVPVFAFGPGADLFSGIYDNTQVYHKMAALWGIK